jgi:hypothetical protein
MSARNGDKSRHGRVKKASLARRVKMRILREEIKAAAAAPKSEASAP